MAAQARRAQTQAAVVGFHHAAQWIVFAVVVSAAWAVQPQLRDPLTLIAVAYLLSVLGLARLRWPIRNAEHRLLAGFALSLLGPAVLLWLGGPALHGLLAMLCFSTTTAWLVLPRRRSVWVMALACALTAIVTLGRGLSIVGAVYAIAFCVSYALLARVAEIAVRRAALAAASVAATSGRDELTGLPGRHAFLREAELVHATAALDKSPYAIEIVDIDNLRAINAAHGYGSGDRAIIVVARALERLRMPGERLARFDADKFAVLVPRLDGSRADDLARRIRSVVYSTTIDVDTQVVRIKANVGVAKYPLSGVTLNALISAAERDMRVDQRGREPPAKKPIFRRRSGNKTA